LKLTHDIFLEQQQRLLMTPELRQAIAILQMSTIELSEHISRELEENPFLDEKEADDNNDVEKNPEAEDGASRTEEWLELFHDRDIGMNTREQAEEKSFDNFMTRRPSLYEHLEFQLHMIYKNPDDLVTGNFLIGSIDSNGYLGVETAEVARQLNISEDRVIEVLDMIQTFHPHGVGARDLSECLLLQLRHYGKENDIARAIIEHHLTDMAGGKVNKIATHLGISIQHVQDMCDLIRTLDPRPGLQYGNSNEIKYIMPDVFAEKLDDEYIVVVNDFNFPRLTINNVYESILRQPNSFNRDARKYLEEKMGAAVWLIRSIEQRRMTLYKVARCIVDIQKEFLDHGVEYMKPLNLRQVAELVEVHESTVSRATTNKYIQTPQGLFELKYFFSTGVGSCHGSQKVSARSIKHMVEEIVAAEDHTNPLSDEAIAAALKKKGIKISRRTVAKYRQELGILSTMARKRY